MSIPRVIHQIWIGEQIPDDIYKYITSITCKCDESGWSHRVWEAQDLRPNGFRLDHELGPPASITNLLRLQILNRYGGVYLDADVELLKPLEPLIQHSAFAALQDTDRICNAVFGCEPGHPWIKWQLDHFNDFANRDAAWGVYLMSAAPREGLTVLPTEFFYPFLWDAKPEDCVPHPNSYLVHHWLKSWG